MPKEFDWRSACLLVIVEPLRALACDRCTITYESCCVWLQGCKQISVKARDCVAECNCGIMYRCGRSQLLQHDAEPAHPSVLVRSKPDMPRGPQPPIPDSQKT